jgi:hypothetical protein
MFISQQIKHCNTSVLINNAYDADRRRCLSVFKTVFIFRQNKKTQYFVLFWKRNTALLSSMYGAGEENRTLIISLEG